MLKNIAVFKDNEYSKGAYRRPRGEGLFEAGKGIATCEETVLFILLFVLFRLRGILSASFRVFKRCRSFVRRANRPDLVDQPRCHDFHPACLGNHERFNEKAYRAFDDCFTVDGFICLLVLTIQII